MPPGERPVEEPKDGTTGAGDESLKDLVATNLFGMSYDELQDSNMSSYKADFRTFFSSTLGIFDDPERILLNLEKGLITADQKAALDFIVEGGAEDFVNAYITQYGKVFTTEYIENVDPDVDTSDEGDVADYLKDNPDISMTAKQHIYQIYFLLEEYKKYKQTQSTILKNTDPYNYIVEQLNVIGENLEPAFEHLNTSLDDVMLRSWGKFRDDNPPNAVAPWQCRIGASTFYVPPTSINVSQSFKAGSFSGAAIRQPNSPKFNSGHSETNIEMTLFFPNHETIWGFIGETAEFNWDPQKHSTNGQYTTSDEEIDFFLSSLRGLITQFRYAPFLPVRNQYLNQAHDIHAVTMLGLSVQTMPEYPFCLMVNLQMAKFNHKVYLPMIDDFDQAFHWGKYRQYMGKAASRLDSIVNQGFLTVKKTPEQIQREQDNAEVDWVKAGQAGRKRDNWEWPDPETVVLYEGDLVPRYDKVADLRDGRFFDFYIPRTTPARLFVPDTTDFRQPGENDVVTREKWNGILDMVGITAIDRPNFNFFEYDTAIRNRQVTSEKALLRNWLELQKIGWESMDSSRLKKFIDESVENAIKAKSFDPDKNPEALDLFKTQLKFNWFLSIYQSYLTDPFFRTKIEQQNFEDNDYRLNEWKVPMEKVIVDWSSCVVQGVSVSLSNSIARLQVQMQDEPVHQHIGGGDSMVNVSMMISGEVNLTRFRRMFEHIGGLARLEHGHGVLGFLGIKNVVTSLCGIKYVIPLSFEVDTVPNFPHVYQVRMSFVDFDVFQQKREQLSSEQQKELIDAFGKRNPFLRIKQKWGAFNAYPDLPLDVRDEDNNIAGHLDPDWYFRAFRNNDTSAYQWANESDLASKLTVYSYLSNNLPPEGDPLRDAWVDERQKYQREIREIIESGVSLPDGWTFDARGNIVSDGTPKLKRDGVPLRYSLGTLDADQSKVYYIEQVQAGSMVLGSYDAKTGKDDEVFLGEHGFREDLASKSITQSSTPSAVPLSSYQKEYWTGADNPAVQFETMMKDWNYRQLDGRMIRAFPTYMLWLIDEGGRFAGMKLFDNFYGLNSVVDFSVMQSEDSLEDTLVLRVSNLFQRLSTPYKDQLIAQDDPLLETPIGKVISVFENRTRNIASGLTDQIIQLSNIRLKPGIRVHLRGGYGSNPNSLQTLFNGVITEVEQGDIMTVIAQSDAVELTAQINTTNKKGHSGTLDGGINTGFWLSEPRDLMVRLLSMGSSAFKEWVSWGTKGVIFSENRFGIRHFGSILYEPLSSKENISNLEKYYAAARSISLSKNPEGAGADALATAGGSLAQDLAGLDFGSFSAVFNVNMIGIMQAMWVNSFKKRDYEIFKRNIYPGNGLGIAQYMAGDMIDAGILVSTMTASLSKEAENSDKKDSPAAPPSAAEVAEENLAVIDATKADLGMSSEDDTALVGLLNENDFVAPDIDISFEEDKNLLEKGFSIAGSLLMTGFEISAIALNPFALTNRVVGWLNIDEIPYIGGPIGFVTGAAETLTNPFAIIGAGKRMLSGPIGSLFGIMSANQDDDLPGYDEVSFRAQTYNKTVWDLFRLCAGLLPNYIVAVRPFEDRSTVFYGKPHWLYTSGVIPISKGVKPAEKPDIEVPDAELVELQRIAQQNMSSFEEFQKQVNDIASLDKQAVGSSVNINAAGYIEGGAKYTVTPDRIEKLPVEWANGAFIPMTEGLASLEMHLPAEGESVTAGTGHKQLADLPPNMRWPYNMDRTAGGGADNTPARIGSDGFAVEWGGGEKYAVGDGRTPNPNLNQTIGYENPSAPGQGGSFGPLPPDVEQWYIASFWPYNSTAVFNKFVAAGEKYKAIAEKGRERELTGSHYKFKRVLVYAPDTQLAVVCGIGEWGPNPGFKEQEKGIPFICGISPDTAHYLGISRGSNVILRAMDDSVPYGPYLDGTDGEALSDNTGFETVDGVITNPTSTTTSRPGDNAIAVNPTTGDSFSVDPKVVTNADAKWWIDRTNERIADSIKNASSEKEKAAYNKAKDLLKQDPVVFAYHFGWKYDTVPSWIDPDTGLGIDVVGEAARDMYDEDASESIDVVGDGKTVEQAYDIWEDFRWEFRTMQEVKDIYLKHFPLTEAADKYDDVMDLFMRSMWQIPSNRAWIVNNSSRVSEAVARQVIDGAINIGGAVGSVFGLDGGGDAEGDMVWDWSAIYPVWETFISSRDLYIDAGGTPISPATKSYMQSNNEDASGSGSSIAKTVDDVKGWFDENIGQFIGMVGDTLSGFLGMLRLSMMQIGVGLSLAGTMQRQANIMNSLFNDSIYYQEGTDGSLLRLVDNPFTREYGEPVVEIREPFQRVHFLSSFQHILSNNISENLNGVPTVVTATSDGKYPVTVHFDKGISPERQVEVSVETGLFWDNAVGSGITGMFQPLIHPIEALRSVTKTATGSSDLLSAKRVALWHLKEGLKDIYTGELLILGNPDIRAHDLVYLADVYERMYGMFEVEKVIHHFTVDGFVTSIVPNAIVTINDPARWSLIAWAWRKMSEHNIRNDARAMLAVKADRNAAIASSKDISSSDIPNIFSNQMLGAVQWTQGNTALIRDFSAMYTMGGMKGLTPGDDMTNKIAKLDQQLMFAKAGLTVGGTVLGALVSGPGAIVGGALGYVGGDLLWKAWGWVKDNLLDQHGCYIQYLNKDGQPLDAGLSYAQGVAVGQHHSISLFPEILGIKSDTIVKQGDNYRITTNDLMAALGWSEVETAYIQRQTSWFVDQINSEVLKVSGRSPDPTVSDEVSVIVAEVLDPFGEYVNLYDAHPGVIDGDTLWVRFIESNNPRYAPGRIEKIRFTGTNTSEVLSQYKQNAYTGFDETTLGPSNDRGILATRYLQSKFSDPDNRIVAIRIDVRQEKSFDRFLGTVFHNLPVSSLGTSLTKKKRGEILRDIALRDPVIPWDSYMEDGRPYTVNWEMVMTGYGNVDMRDSLWNSQNPNRSDQLSAQG